MATGVNSKYQIEMQTIKDIVKVVKYTHLNYSENLQFMLEANHKILIFG